MICQAERKIAVKERVSDDVLKRIQESYPNVTRAYIDAVRNNDQWAYRLKDYRNKDGEPTKDKKATTNILLYRIPI